jgi:hypothetical protein
MNPSIETRCLFILSTAHITKQTAETHNQYREDAYLWPVPYGYICWLWDDQDRATSDMPPDLRDCITYLTERHGAGPGDYVRFDCDAAKAEGLKTYDW